MPKIGQHIWQNRKHPMFGKHHSKETLRKMSISQTGKNNGMFGKHHSKHTKKIMSKMKKGIYKGNKHGRWNGGIIKKDGYIFKYSPNHPYKNTDNRVLEHRLVMEKYLGRYLELKEVIHHINGNRSDNRIENLMLFKNISEHFIFHKKFNR